MDPTSALQLGDLCVRLCVEPRHARYVLEEGYLPPGVDPSPGRGEHRQLTPAQAYWLGIILKLKVAGLGVPLAKNVADTVYQKLPEVASKLDPGFAPFQGRMLTDRKWFIEVGDLTYWRFITNAYRDRPRTVGWRRFDRRLAYSPEPVVVVRLDLVRLAALLGGK